jgi:hypothetical protein
VKKLLVLWDPSNPLVPAAPVVQALKNMPDIGIRALTFDEVGHPTLPNGSFQLRPVLGSEEPEGILWIEGGPFPSDLVSFSCPKSCWLVNTHQEPSLMEEVAPHFDRVFSASLRDTAEDRARWLPVSSDESVVLTPPPGISVLVDDPRPPSHAHAEQALMGASEHFGPTPVPLVVAMGNGGQVHPMLFDSLKSGAAVLVSPECDLRGIAHAGEHLEVFPSNESLVGFVRELLKNPERLRRLSSRAPAIVEHLHRPEMRAARICAGFWPESRVLSGREHRPRVSILVTCYRYLRRLRVCLESLARQEAPPGSLEIVVADPASPDGLSVALEEFAGRYPELRLLHLPIDSRYHRNRGVGINRAFEVSQGRVVIAIDGDLVFPPHLVALLEANVVNHPDRVFGVRRAFIGKDETERILRGELDPFAEFERLSRSAGDGEEKAFVGVLGYCQAVDRRAFARARYPEEFNLVNQSDIVFLERLAKEAGVSPHYLQDQTVLHLWHPRNWMGTTESL